MTAFARRVLSILRRIPAGRVTTYGDVARLAGKPGAARAVGNVLRAAGEPGLPYHRVIASDGQVGGYGRNPEMKRALLSAEGHVVRRGRVVGFADTRWPDRRSTKPGTSASDRLAAGPSTMLGAGPRRKIPAKGRATRR